MPDDVRMSHVRLAQSNGIYQTIAHRALGNMPSDVRLRRVRLEHHALERIRVRPSMRYEAPSLSQAMAMRQIHFALSQMILQDFQRSAPERPRVGTRNDVYD